MLSNSKHLVMASITNILKVEDGSNSDNSCFLCLEQVTSKNNEKFDSLNFFLKYLKVRDKVTLIVCDKCGDCLIKFEKLSNILEKVTLEMNYLLDCIKCKISNSNNFKPASIKFTSVRESVMKKCEDKMYNPQPKLLLEGIDLTNLVKNESSAPSVASDDWSPNSDNNNSDCESTFSDSNNYKSSTTPVGEIKSVESELNLQVSATTCNDGGFATNGRIKCTKCSKTYRSKTTLRRHNNYAHRVLIRPFKCTICSNDYCRIEELSSHVNNVHFRLNHQKCDICGKTLANLQSFKRHKLLCKPKPQIPIDKLVSCKKCGKDFDNPKSLNVHVYNVHPKKKFPCHICNKMFKIRTNLYKHIASIHEKQRFYCKVPGCGNSYSQTQNLSIHYRKDHPNFKRQVVNKKPSYYSDKFKIITSNGNEEVECLICKKHFTSVNTVRIHLQTIHGLKKYKCKFCGYKTDSKASFDDHIKQKHETSHVNNGEVEGNSVEKEKIFNSVPHLILKRIDHSEFTKRQIPASTCSDNGSPNTDTVNPDNETNGSHAAAPVIYEIKNIKTEIYLENPQQFEWGQSDNC